MTKELTEIQKKAAFVRQTVAFAIGRAVADGRKVDFYITLLELLDDRDKLEQANNVLREQARITADLFGPEGKKPK